MQLRHLAPSELHISDSFVPCGSADPIADMMEVIRPCIGVLEQMCSFADPYRYELRDLEIDKLMLITSQET